MYDWKTFSDLRKKYEAGAVFIKKGSKIKDDLEQVGENEEYTRYFGPDDRHKGRGLNEFIRFIENISKKAEITAKLLTASANFNSLINDCHLHYALFILPQEELQSEEGYPGAKTKGWPSFISLQTWFRCTISMQVRY